jgi:hypothetical protein
VDKVKPWLRLSRKQSAEAASTHNGLAAPGQKCMDGECLKPATCRCTYVDRRQVKCGTTWCDEHSRIVLGLPYCRRHATVAPSLANGFFTHMLPDVENRAPSLASWVGAELDTAVRIALTADAPHKEAYVVSGAVRPVRVPGSTMPVWLRSWTLVDSTGVLQHVSIEVDEEDDRAVVVRVGGEPMGRHQPPWIGRPRTETIAPELDAAARQAFRITVMHDIELGLLGARVDVAS